MSNLQQPQNQGVNLKAAQTQVNLEAAQAQVYLEAAQNQTQNQTLGQVTLEEV